MVEAVAYPFLRPSGVSVRAGPWLLAVADGEVRELGEVIAHWDYTMNLVVSRTLTIDTNELLWECQFKGEAVVLLSVELTTGDAGIRNSIWQERVKVGPDRERLEQQIDLELEGQKLQGRVELTTSLSYLNGKSASTLSPTMIGSRLWDHQQVAHLEGGGGRLPMEASDFTALDPRLARAPWILHVETTDPYASFIGNVQVRLNSHRKDIVDAVRKREGPVLERLTNDLVRHLVSRVIDDEEFSGRSDEYEPGSIGRTVSIWLESAFPGQPIEQVRAMRLQSTARFDAMLASGFGGHYGD